MAQTDQNYSWIDTTQGAQDACAILQVCSRIAVDIEGINLGRDGKICIIQIATDLNEIFLFDIVTLSQEAFDAGLKEIFESSTIQKIIFDCRQDCDALLHQYNTRMRRVCDCQVALMSTRDRVRADRLTGLKRALASSTVIPASDIQEVEHIKEEGINLFAEEKGGSYAVWEERPLHPMLKKYCCVDIQYLLPLYDSYLTKLARKRTLLTIESTSQIRADYHMDLEIPMENGKSRALRDFK